MSEGHNRQSLTTWQKVKPILETLSWIAAITGWSLASLSQHTLFWWALGSIILTAAIVRILSRRPVGRAQSEHGPATITADDILKGINADPPEKAPEPIPAPVAPRTERGPSAKKAARGLKDQPIPAKPSGQPQQRKANRSRRPKPTADDRPLLQSEPASREKPTTIRFSIPVTRLDGGTLWGSRVTEELLFEFRCGWQGDYVVSLETLCPKCGTSMDHGPDQEIMSNPGYTLLSCRGCGLRRSVHDIPEGFRMTVTQAIRRQWIGAC